MTRDKKFDEVWEEYKECYYRPLELDDKLTELITRFENAGGIDYSKIPNEPNRINLQLYYCEYKREIEEEQRRLNLRRVALKQELENIIRARIKKDVHRRFARKRIIDLKTAHTIAHELGYSEQHARKIVSECFGLIKKDERK